jgi:prepilin-type N-terminal cleavage/methylation domain-containing protein
MTHRTSAFTLIELLIVVAIIAILAAIAVPNFLEAQVRAKISRVKSDMRTVATAIESYHVDNSAYPDAYRASDTSYFNNRLMQVTSPVAYITALPVDIFRSMRAGFPDPPNMKTATFEYVDRRTAAAAPGNLRSFRIFATDAQFDNYFDFNKATTWFMFSPGPVFKALPFDNVTWGTNPIANAPPRQRLKETYDATNGTVSLGAIWRTNAVQ